MQIIDGVREAKEYETWLNKQSTSELNEINTVLTALHTPKLSEEIFRFSLDDRLVNYMSQRGYELAEIIRNNRSFYRQGDIEATIDEFYYDEKGRKLIKPQINIEIESDRPGELQKVCQLLGLNKDENEQNVWWDACKGRSY